MMQGISLKRWKREVEAKGWESGWEEYLLWFELIPLELYWLTRNDSMPLVSFVSSSHQHALAHQGCVALRVLQLKAVMTTTSCK